MHMRSGGKGFLIKLMECLPFQFMIKGKNIIIVRDRIGEKPLYYYKDSDFLYGVQN